VNPLQIVLLQGMIVEEEGDVVDVLPTIAIAAGLLQERPQLLGNYLMEREGAYRGARICEVELLELINLIAEADLDINHAGRLAGFELGLLTAAPNGRADPDQQRGEVHILEILWARPLYDPLDAANQIQIVAAAGFGVAIPAGADLDIARKHTVAGLGVAGPGGVGDDRDVGADAEGPELAPEGTVRVAGDISDSGH
jgi:hypothetical protein